MRRAGHDVLAERDHERNAITAALDAACRRDGRFVLLEGAPGSGKSALLAHAADAAGARGMVVRQATGDEFERDLPLGAVLQLVGGDDADVEVDGSAEGALAVQRLWRQTRALAEDAPLLLVADDLQWWDEPSLRVMLHAVRRLSGQRIVVVGAARTGRREGEGLLARLASLATVRLHVRPLSERGVEEVVRAALGTTTPDLVRACAEATGGNPFLLVELLRALGAAESPPERLVSLVGGLAPAAVLDSVVARLDRLPQDAFRVAKAVAILGDSAPARHVPLLLDVPRPPVEQAVDDLVEAHLLAPGRPLCFAHPLLRSAVHATIGESERLDLHARAATVLLADGVPPEHVARHLVEARRDRQAWVVDTLRTAARRALAAGSPAVAARYLRRALEEPPEGEHRAEVLIELGRAEGVTGVPTAAERFRQALDLTTEPRKRAEAAFRLGQRLLADSQTHAAMEVLEKALPDAEGDPELTARLEISWVVAARNDLATRPAARGRLAALVDEAPEGRTRAERALLAELAYEEGLTGRSADLTADLALRALGGPDLTAVHDLPASPRHVAVLALIWSGRLDLAERVVSHVLDRARRTGHAVNVANAGQLRANVMSGLGQVEATLADIEIALTEPVVALFRPGAQALRALALLEHGEPERAREALVLPGPRDRWTSMASYHFHLFVQARVALDLGDAAGALEAASECGRFAEAMGTSNPAVMGWRLVAARALDVLGRRDEARRLVEDDLALARRFGAPRAIGSGLRVAASLTDGDEAVVLLREAVERLEESRDRLELASALIDLGIVLERELPDDSTALLRRGLELAEPVGGRVVAQRARRALDRDAPAATTEPSFLVRLLGEFEVRVGDQVRTAPPAAARLVKLLSLAGRAVHLEELVEVLWPGDDADLGRARLRRLLGKAREHYGPIVVRRGDLVGLAAGVDVDLAEFEERAARAFAAAREASPDTAALARDAVARYGGDLLPADAYASWAADHRDRLRRRYVDLLDVLVRASEQAGDPGTAADLLARTVALEPCDDERCADVARLLAAAGRRAEAADWRHRAAAIRRELGLE